MSNTLTALSPLLFSAAQTIANERTAMLEAISNTFDDKGVAIGDKVIVPVAPPATLAAFTPSNIPPSGMDATAQNVQVTITNSSKVSWNLTGEQQRSLENATIETDWIRQMVEQGMRTLRNDAELKAWTAALAGASRAVGTGGQTPFQNSAGTTIYYQLNALAAAKKVLLDQGCPDAGLTAIIDTNAGLNLRQLGVYQNFYQAGSPDQLRQGIFLPAFGIAIAESAQVGQVAAGSASNLVTTDSTDALTTQTIGVGGQGATLSLSSNDFVTFGTTPATAAYHVINSSTLSSAGNILLNRPGIAKVPLASGMTVTPVASYTGNVVLERSSVVGAIRPPIIPDNPTIEQLKISDTKTGLTFLMLDIAQYGQRTWELHLAYGFAAVQPAFICALLG
jgi:hypothetical protein